MTQDNDNLKPDSEEKESREPEETPASEDPVETDSSATEGGSSEPPVADAETIYEPPEAKPSLELPDSGKSSGGGLTQWILLILIAILGTGGFFYYQEQNKFQQSVLERLTQLETQVNSLQSNQDLSRSNADRLESLYREVTSLKSQVNQTLKSHQNSLSMLDEDIVRLKDELKTLQGKAGTVQEAPPASDRPEVTSIPEEPMEPLREERKPSVAETFPPAEPDGGGTDDSDELEPQRPQEAQEYIDFVETTTEKFFRLVKEGFANLWRWFASIFE